MPRTKPPAKEITRARESAKRHRTSPGEQLATAPRQMLAPTKKRPAGETSLTWNLELERPRRAPPKPRPTHKAASLRVGKRAPKAARSQRQAASAKKH